MGLSTNTDLQAIFGQVDGLLAKLPSGTEGGSSFNAGEFFKLGNILNGSLDLEGGSSGSNGDQTANMIKSTINTVMSLLDKITNQEAKAAREEVKKLDSDGVLVLFDLCHHLVAILKEEGFFLGKCLIKVDMS